MFGFSITKILFTVGIIAAIWFAFKAIGRLQEQREVAARQSRASKRTSDRTGSKETAADAIEDMVACSACGDFIPAKGARACGRDKCPYPG